MASKRKNRFVGDFEDELTKVSSPEVVVDENLVDFANKELDLAGLMDQDSDYDGMLGQATIELVKTFADQGHSGMSADLVRDLFNRLSNYQPLTAITDNPDDWMEIGEQDPRTPTGQGAVWQCKRNPSLFSEDGGKTYYNIDDEKFKIYKSDHNK